MGRRKVGEGEGKRIFFWIVWMSGGRGNGCIIFLLVCLFIYIVRLFSCLSFLFSFLFFHSTKNNILFYLQKAKKTDFIELKKELAENNIKNYFPFSSSSLPSCIAFAPTPHSFFGGGWGEKLDRGVLEEKDGAGRAVYLEKLSQGFTDFLQGLFFSFLFFVFFFSFFFSFSHF